MRQIVDTVRVCRACCISHLTTYIVVLYHIKQKAPQEPSFFGWGQLPPRLRSLGQRDQRSNSDFNFFSTPTGKSIFATPIYWMHIVLYIHNIEANLLFHDPFIQFALKSLKSIDFHTKTDFQTAILQVRISNFGFYSRFDKDMLGDRQAGIKTGKQQLWHLSKLFQDRLLYK